jgi:hypothetical protein
MGTQNKKHIPSAFVQVIGLGLFIMAVFLFMFVTESELSAIKLINIIMTLGGLETYDETVIGFGMIVFLLGITAIAFAQTKKSHKGNKPKKTHHSHGFQRKLEHFFKV